MKLQHISEILPIRQCRVLRYDSAVVQRHCGLYVIAPIKRRVFYEYCHGQLWSKTDRMHHLPIVTHENLRCLQHVKARQSTSLLPLFGLCSMFFSLEFRTKRKSIAVQALNTPEREKKVSTYFRKWLAGFWRVKDRAVYKYACCFPFSPHITSPQSRTPLRRPSHNDTFLPFGYYCRNFYCCVCVCSAHRSIQVESSAPKTLQCYCDHPFCYSRHDCNHLWWCSIPLDQRRLRYLRVQGCQGNLLFQW